MKRVGFGLRLAAAGAMAAVLLLPGCGGDGELSEQTTALIARADAELAKPKVDRAACRDLLAEVRNAPEVAAPLTRAEAGLLFRMDRLQEAWRVLQPQAQGAEAEIEDLLLGARIQRRQHGTTGKEADGFQALTLAKSHHEQTGSKASLFLAWQMARRLARREAESKFAEQMLAGFADSFEGQLVAVLKDFHFTVPANKTPQLPELSKAATAKLRKLEEDQDPVPEELHVALAMAEVSATDPSRIRDGVDRLKREVLPTYSCGIMARMLTGIGSWRLKELDDARFHLGWLLDNHGQHPAAPWWRGFVKRIDQRK